MENIKELLDAVKHAKGIASDYALAKSLDLPRARICDYYKGNRAPDEFACLKIAEALGQPLDTIIAKVKAATEKDKKRREAWENYMKRLGGLAASLVLSIATAVTLIVTPTPAKAAVTSSDLTIYDNLQIMRSHGPTTLTRTRCSSRSSNNRTVLSAC